MKVMLRPEDVLMVPEEPKDKDFLRELYFTTRYDIDRAPVEESKKRQLKQIQFEAQYAHYKRHYSGASFDLVCEGDRPIGRIYVDVRSDEVRLIDIALLPEYRGLGIGRRLLRECQEKALAANLPLRLRVEPDNPALRLYQRMGFKVIADEQVNLHMEWLPNRLEGDGND